MLNARLKKGAKAEFRFPEGYNTAALVIEGNILINSTDTAPADHFVLFSNDGEQFTVESDEDSIVLIISGEPIREPIAAHGPFVMNTEDEIRQAIADYRAGTLAQ